MNNKLKKALTMLTVFCMVMSMLCAPAFGMETDSPYWKITREVDGATQTVTHAVLDSKGNLVNIGAEPGKLDISNLEAGTMTAQKFGAFEDEDDAANGIVKLTFDVAGKPIEVPGPLDVVIIADESGSLNMYGRAVQNVRFDDGQNIRNSASYMPCLNGEHAYLAGDLQRELYQIALARYNAAAGKVDESLKTAVSEALKDENPANAITALLTAENDAAAAAEKALADANASLTVAEAAHAPFADAVQAAADALKEAEIALEAAKNSPEQLDVDAAEAAHSEAQRIYDEAVKTAQPTADAVAEAKSAAENAAASLENAKTALEEKKDAVGALVNVIEMEGKLADEQVGADIYVNPHDGNLEYITFGQWGNAGNEASVRKMVEAGKFVDGTSANIEIPNTLTDDDVYLALLFDWDKVEVKSNGQLTFTTNYPANGTVKAEKGKRMGWNPDTAHCYFTNGAYVLIDQPMNEDKVTEENALYSYWSPDADNEYGCFDRMIIEKEGIVTLAKQILNADPVNNRVAYVGFTRGAYPSLSSFGLGDNGFCGLNDEDLDEMLSIMGNTNGHDYTNYIHPLYMARKIISMREDQNRPCYVVFISDGVPTTSGGFTKQPLVKDGGWNVLSLDNGDYPWYDDVYNNSSTHVEAAGKMAGYFKEFLKETAGEDTQFYTVGFSTNEAASGLLKSMASDEDSFFNCANVSEFMNKMQVVQQEIMIHYPSGVLTDIIGEDFNLLVDQGHPFTVDGVGYADVEAAAEAGSVAVEGASLSWNLENVDEEGVQISFYVKLTDEELKKFEDGSTRVYDTNADTWEATGAKLEYHKLIADSTKSEGYYAEEDASVVPLKTPKLKIWNGEVTPDNNNNNNNNNDDPYIPPTETPEETLPPAETPEVTPPVDVTDQDVPQADRSEDDPLLDGSDDDIPLGNREEGDVPKTGDPFTMWMLMSALSGSGLAGMSVLNYKKRDEE